MVLTGDGPEPRRLTMNSVSTGKAPAPWTDLGGLHMSEFCQRCQKPVTLSTNMMRWISPPPAGGFTTHIACPEEGETEEEAIQRQKVAIRGITMAGDAAAPNQLAASQRQGPANVEQDSDSRR